VIAASNPASVDDGDDRNDPPKKRRSAMLAGGLTSGGGPDPSSSSWEEVLHSISGVKSEAEIKAAIEETRRNSSVADYYPRRPETSG
jgi:hypothetical protein